MRGIRRGIAGIVVAVAALALCASASARTITVATTDANSNTVCTLNDAISAANDNLPRGGCVAGQALPTVDRINFGALTGTISIGLGAFPQLVEDVKIDGPGSSELAIEGQTRPFQINPAATASISGLTISGTCGGTCGSKGGAIFNGGDLTLDSVVITNSFAVALNGPDSLARGGAIWNQTGASLAVTNSTLTDNGATANGGSATNIAGGGAVTNLGTMTLARTTLKGNFVIASAPSGTTGTSGGGAVENDGDLTITGSTLSGNSSINSGAGSKGSIGGAIVQEVNPSGSLTVENSTIAGNDVDTSVPTAQGGGVFLTGTQAAIRSSTITGNAATDGANLMSQTPPSIGNSILADPVGGTNCAGYPVVSAGYNVESTDGCGFAGPGDMTTTDPMLQPLGNYGGPTQTRAPLVGSPVIDAGKAAAGQSTDQRGLFRPSDLLSIPDAAGGDGSDIGAVEIQDVLAPDTVIDSGPAAGSLSNRSSQTFTFHSTDPNSSFECRLDGGNFASCPTPKVVNSLSDGNHTFAVRALDGTRNTDPTPATRAFSIDTTAPKTTIGRLPSKTKKRAVKVTFKSSDKGATFKCRLDKRPFKSCRSPLKLKHLKPGKHKFQVKATDQLGNAAKSPTAKSFTVVRKK